eukprot:COSAG01_NODE_13030_length_1646_cov_2.294764_2_plen_137_part_00
MLRTLFVVVLHAVPLFAAPMMKESLDPRRDWRVVHLAGPPVGNNATSQFALTTERSRIVASSLALPAAGPNMANSKLIPGPSGEGYAVLTVGSEAAASSFLLVDAEDQAAWNKLGAPLLNNRLKGGTDNNHPCVAV